MRSCRGAELEAQNVARRDPETVSEASRRSRVALSRFSGKIEKLIPEFRTQMDIFGNSVIFGLGLYVLGSD